MEKYIPPKRGIKQTERKTGTRRLWTQCRGGRKGIHKTSMQDQKKQALYLSREQSSKSEQNDPNSNRSFGINFSIRKKSYKKEGIILGQKVAQMCYNNMNTEQSSN